MQKLERKRVKRNLRKPKKKNVDRDKKRAVCFSVYNLKVENLKRNMLIGKEKITSNKPKRD